MMADAEGTARVPRLTAPRDVAAALRAVTHESPLEIVITRELWALIAPHYTDWLRTRDAAPRAALRRWRRAIEPICQRLERMN